MYKVRAMGLLFLMTFLTACATTPLQTLSPQVRLTDFRAGEMGIMEQNFVMRLVIENPNPIPLPIVGMDYQLMLNDKEFVKGKNDNKVTVPAQGEEYVEIDIKTSLTDILQQVTSWKLATTQQLDYNLSGNVNMTDFSIALPFEQEGSVPLSW